MDIDKLKAVIRETVIETYEELLTPFHIIVVFHKKDHERLKNLLEDQWVPSSINDYLQRLESPQYGFDKARVHLARKRHVNLNSKHVAWNEDGVRHSRKTYNTRLNYLESVKRIATKALKLPKLFSLEPYTKQVSSRLMLETIDYLPRKCNVFILIAVSKDKKNIMGE